MIGITIEHEQIRDWTCSRGGSPVIDKSDDKTCPTIRFPSEAEGDDVSWDEWMASFEQGEWAFIYQDRTPEGELSRHWKIIPRFELEEQWTCEVKNSSAN
jgi:hypothetical protein